MKKITLLLLSLFSIIAGWSQIPNWDWGYNYEAFNSDTRGLTATAANGDVYLIGNFQSASITVGTTTLTNPGAANTGEIYIVKYNSSGVIQWVKKEGGLNMDMINSITTDGNGNFYLCGSFVNQITIGTTTLSHSGNVSFIAKYNASGDSIWVKKIGSTGEGCYPYKIKADTTGNIYMTGYFTTPTVTFDTFVVTNTNYDVSTGGTPFVAKLDTSGNATWAKAIQRTGTTVFSNIAHDLAFDANGNVFIGGYFFSNTMQFDGITLSNPQSQANTIFMAKYDSNGNALWARTPTSTFPNNFITAVSTDASGNVYFSGTFTNTMAFDSVIVTASSSGNKLFTVKYDGSGVVQWARTATNTTGSSYSNIDSSDVDAQGNLYVTGTYTATTLNFGNGIFATNSGSGNLGGLFVVKYNSSGTPLWIRTANSLDINNRISIDCKNENEIYIAGYFYNPSITFGGLTLTKTNTTGYNIFIAKLNYVPLGTSAFTEANLQVAPNPVEDVLHISEIEGTYQYSLVDAIGKTMLSGELDTINNTISFADFAAGIYFLQLQNEQGEKMVKRILKK